MLFDGENAQLEAKQHDYWLKLVALAATIPIQASSESANSIDRQRAVWLQENAKEIAKLTKHAKNHANGTSGAAVPEEDGAS